jgi:hypothetical protein
MKKLNEIIKPLPEMQSCDPIEGCFFEDKLYVPPEDTSNLHHQLEDKQNLAITDCQNYTETNSSISEDRMTDISSSPDSSNFSFVTANENFNFA